jgi:hypothetical protein
MPFPTNDHISAVIIPALEAQALTESDNAEILRWIDHWNGVLLGTNFREYPNIAIPARALATGWIDASWHNDAMARMFHSSEVDDENAVSLWVGNADTMADLECNYLYAVNRYGADVDVYTGNDIDAAIDAANAEIARRIEQ